MRDLVRIVMICRMVGFAAAGILVAILTAGADARGRLSEGGAFKRADAFGCTRPEDYVGLTDRPSAGRAAADKVRDRLVRSGACASFAKGEPFTIEEELGDLVCLRPQSERDCLWSGRVSIGG